MKEKYRLIQVKTLGNLTVNKCNIYSDNKIILICKVIIK